MAYFNVGKINYEGPQSKNHLSFKYYNPEEIIRVNHERSSEV